MAFEFASRLGCIRYMGLLAGSLHVTLMRMYSLLE